MRAAGCIVALATAMTACRLRADLLYWMIDGKAGDSFSAAYLQTLESANGKADNVVARLYSLNNTSSGVRILSSSRNTFAMSLFTSWIATLFPTFTFSALVTVATNPTRLLLFALPFVFLLCLDISKNLFTFGFLLMFLDIFFNLLMRCLIVFWQTFKSFIFLKVHRLSFRLL